MRPLLIMAGALVAGFVAYALTSGSTAPRDAQPVPVAQAGSDPVILAAGDIADCTTPNDELTADLLDTLAGTILTLGDLAYENGSTADFDNCYDPTWGRHFGRTKPSPGNHEYNTANAAPYYAYFGAAAGDPTKGYYSFDIGTWHIVSLNSNCNFIGGCGVNSPQQLWLKNDLRTHPAACTLAYWHHPRFSSGSHGNNSFMQAMYQTLYDYGADVVLAGHDHHYERLKPQTATGVEDAAYGVRQFVVGTGGRTLYTLGTIKPNTEIRDNTSYGVLQMTLHATSYDFSFLPAAGSSFTDTGSGTCHGAALDPDADGWLNTEDNCPSNANNDQANTDGNFTSNAPLYAMDDTTWVNSDGSGNACDGDDDNDGLPDADEGTGALCDGTITDPLLRDSDGDRFLDGAECAHLANPASDLSVPALASCGDTNDTDGDKLTNRLEACFYGSSPTNANTDGDACSDGREVTSLNADTTVNSGDQGMLAAELLRVPPPSKLLNFDLNKDGTINSGDQGQMASRLGACP
jgi:hypothetical protein